ncbi:hypothetical protein SAMN04488033_1223 [Salegentibacter agarivorans]|uniref:Uncharacterized protein n=1 Tax=Salegentibacter agarivorans TaxID=345907 RepID=A0A1I2NHE2_9FLAO|nr:hypothetical protein [Salegentibacter agarivorans]SFG03324.1 hypothetical protein SAMN04488033_1223 [Salegentibacter agarivorans]
MTIKTSTKVFNLLSLISLGCLLIVIKNSTLSTPNFIPNFIADLLQKPQVNTETGELFRLLENFSLAIISGYLIYLIIDFIPNKIASRKAFLACKSNIKGIYLTMSSIIAPLKMIIDLNKDDKEIKIEDLKKIEKYKPEFERTYYQSRIIIFNSKEIIKQEDLSKGVFTFHHSLDEFHKKLSKQIEDLFRLPISNNLDYKLVEILSSIDNSQFLKLSKNMNKYANLGSYTLHNSDLHLYEFLQLYLKLEKYNFDKHKYTFKKLPENEIANLKEERERIFQQQNYKDGKFYHNNVEYIVKDGKLI